MLKMKNVKWVLVSIFVWFFVGCASNTNTPISSKHIQKENLEGAKYIGGKIWQDQQVNNSKKLKVSDSVKYCQNLNLLGIQEWKLPSIDDVRSLGADAGKLEYLRTGTYYHTSSQICKMVDLSRSSSRKSNGLVSTLFVPVETILGAAMTPLKAAENIQSGKHCQYRYKNNNQLITSESSRSGLVRCVLDANTYSQHQSNLANKASNSRGAGTYTGYLEAFQYSKSIQDIKKAYSLANTNSQKLNAERIMVKTIPEKVFTIIDGKTGASNVQTKGANLLNISGASMSGKDFSKNFVLKSDFLQYGSYRVKVKFNFDAVYRVKQILGSSDQRMHKEMTVVYHLNSANQYRDVKNITFKGVIVNVQGGAFGVKTYSAKMKSNDLSYKIIGVE